jgi:glucose/arabinose dehydrogenase
VQVRLSRIATFTDPVAMALRSGDGAFYIAERRGRIRAFRGGAVDPNPVLDIAGAVSTGTEQGLLGLAFSPDGSKLYVVYTDTDNTTRVVEYAMNGLQADPATRRELLAIPQPYSNNKGGQLAFGPDGMLWIGLGDGGGGGDPLDNAQKQTSLLGKILRIDPRPSGGASYLIPGDNPFAGTPGARPEIWAYGLRNPSHFSFDRATGDLWIGDVGQNARDEVDLQAAGARGGQNYGWPRVEGTKPYSGAAPSGAVGPLFDIPRASGACGITGGYVYRGIRVGGLIGAYVYADRCVGQITAVRQTGGQVVDTRAFSAIAKPLTAFGQDGAGDLYALTQDGGLHRIDPA